MVDSVDNGELVVEVGGVTARASTSEAHAGPALHRVRDVLVHLRCGRRVGEWPHRCSVVEGIAEHGSRGSLDDCVGEVGCDALIDEHALGRAAHLSGVPVGTEDRGLCRGGDIGVGTHDDGAVAGRFHQRALQASRAHDPLRGRR